MLLTLQNDSLHPNAHTIIILSWATDVWKKNGAKRYVYQGMTSGSVLLEVQK